MPLISTKTIKSLLAQSQLTGFSLLSVTLDEPSGYGRIVRDKNKVIQAIIEQKDADEEETKN